MVGSHQTPKAPRTGGRRVKEAIHQPRALVLTETDGVAILLDPAIGGDTIVLLDSGFGSIGNVEAREPIEPFHKVAIRKIDAGDSVVKLGETIGRASCSIARGDHVHVHNVVSARLS